MLYVIGFLVLNLIFFYILIRKYINYKEKEDELIDVRKKVVEITEELRTNRKGYIDSTVVYDSKTYKYKMFIKELKRFKNGESEIQIEKIEVYMYDAKIVNTIKSYIISTTPSIMDSDLITWLDLEEDVKELRITKLNKIKEILDKCLPEDKSLIDNKV